MALSTASGCALDVSFDGSRYACEPPAGRCPIGYLCADDGYCERTAPPPLPDAARDAAAALDGGGNDGEVAMEADAAAVDAAHAPDAPPPPPPDAAPPPDAHTGPTTVVLVAARDTQLHGGQTTLNFGGAPEVVCNGNPDMPVLFGWNLSAIPTSATVQSAVMRLSTGDNALQGETASVFALLQDWTEGNLNGQAGVANYQQRKANTAWATAGAKPPSRGVSAVATFAPTTPDTSYDVTLPTSLVQAWVSSPSSNFGVIVTCPFSNDVAFHTRVEPGLQPRLTVTYSP